MGWSDTTLGRMGFHAAPGGLEISSGPPVLLYNWSGETVAYILILLQSVGITCLLATVTFEIKGMSDELTSRAIRIPSK